MRSSQEAGPLVTAHDVEVRDSTMRYVESGAGRSVVFLHGNPTSSYLWRNVIPPVASRGRCLAPDLIGMGKSGKPKIGYRFLDHARYLDAWFDALGLRDVTLVGHDWGGALAVYWARRNPDRVAGVALMETIVRELTWEEWPEEARRIFQGFRTPDTGEDLILEKNLFVERVLPTSVLRTLSEEEMQTYRAPYLEKEARLPTLQWPRELPIDGEPADVTAIIQANAEWLASSPQPKLLLTFEPGAIMRKPLVDWCRNTIQNLEVRHIGPGIHFVQEDQPDSIGEAIAVWRLEKGLT